MNRTRIHWLIGDCLPDHVALLEAVPGVGNVGKLIVDALNNHSKIDPSKVIIDHVEEHTVKMVLDDGFWAGMTLYPETKCTSNRAIDILEVYGNERIWMNSACDWGASVPLSVPMAMQEMKRRGKSLKTIDKIVYQNPIDFMSQSPRFLKPNSL